MAVKESADKTIARAKQAAKAGDLVGAVEAFQSVIARFPKNKRAQQGMAALKPSALPQVLRAAQEAQGKADWAEAERLLQAAVALAPEMAEVWLALSACQLEMRKAPAALMAAERVLAALPDQADALNCKGRALREMGRGDEAQACFKAALGNAATDAQTYTNLGILARARGDREGASGYYRKALELQPNEPLLHANLSQVTTYVGGEEHVAQMRAALAAKGADAPESAALHFALFKALDDMGERAEAFAHLQKGNALKKQALGYDFQSDARPYAVSKILFEAPVGEAAGKLGLRPIFVTGLPRTGTSLVERMLGQGDGVQTCGELPVVQNAVGRLLRRVMGRDKRVLKRADLEVLREELLDGLAAYSDGSPVLVDKMPLNFRWIGYICAALPESSVVHLARDPMAVAWSLFRHDFVGAGNGFAYDVADIGRFMVLHREWMAHWRAVCPGRIVDVSYADLVEAPEAATRALAEGVGLDWSEAWLAPEKARGQVLTASAEQVRRPIYTGSDAGWRAYEAELAPMRQALETAGLV